MNGMKGDALDRHITGNYGEDQFDGLDADGRLYVREVDFRNAGEAEAALLRRGFQAAQRKNREGVLSYFKKTTSEPEGTFTVRLDSGERVRRTAYRKIYATIQWGTPTRVFLCRDLRSIDYRRC
jgi:hypothetical protein